MDEDGPRLLMQPVLRYGMRLMINQEGRHVYSHSDKAREVEAKMESILRHKVGFPTSLFVDVQALMDGRGEGVLPDGEAEFGGKKAKSREIGGHGWRFQTQQDDRVGMRRGSNEGRRGWLNTD